LPEENTGETMAMMKYCSYLEVSGNHQTNLYGNAAKEIANAIKDFLLKEWQRI
jgi:hypothetical protein